MKKNKKLSHAEVSLFCSQLNYFMKSGINIDDALGLMMADWNGKRFKRVLDTVNSAVYERMALNKAMEVSGAFPTHAVKMTGIGEIAGNLELVMDSLAHFYEREQKNRERLRGFVFNSLLLVVMMGAVVLLLIIEVLPMFDDLLTSMGGEMPGIIKAFMRAGAFLAGHYIIIAAAAAAFIAAAIVLFKLKPGILDRFKARFPFIRTVYGKIITARFTGALTLLAAGDVEQHTVFEMVNDVLNNTYLAKRLKNCEETAYGTGSVYEAIDKEGIFPEKVSKMLIFGEKAGNILSMAVKLAETYEAEVDKTMNKISAAAEVTFITLITLVIGIILVSVILPMIRIMSLVG
jgi:type IV pilus assembly protein PilC